MKNPSMNISRNGDSKRWGIIISSWWCYGRIPVFKLMMKWIFIFIIVYGLFDSDYTSTKVKINKSDVKAYEYGMDI